MSNENWEEFKKRRCEELKQDIYCCCSCSDDAEDGYFESIDGECCCKHYKLWQEYKELK
jgi:hypothetical protein